MLRGRLEQAEGTFVVTVTTIENVQGVVNSLLARTTKAQRMLRVAFKLGLLPDTSSNEVTDKKDLEKRITFYKKNKKARRLLMKILQISSATTVLTYLIVRLNLGIGFGLCFFFFFHISFEHFAICTLRYCIPPPRETEQTESRREKTYSRCSSRSMIYVGSGAIVFRSNQARNQVISSLTSRWSRYISPPRLSEYSISL